MDNNRDNIEQKLTWRFPASFWFANLMELCERFAYYGFFIVLTLYLTNLVGFDDIWTGVISGFFMAGVYFLPPFVGAYVDKIGFKKGLIIAFGTLTVGYFLLGIHQGKVTSIIFLLILMVGASFIKPLITGTVAKTTDEANRARGFSLFYWVVNVGAFLGKSLVPAIRQGIGLEYVNFFSAGMTFLAMLIAIFFYKTKDDELAQKKTFEDVWNALVNIFTQPRLIILTVIIAGFWVIQHQLYATMPKYVIRQLGESAKPEWIANVNPAVVVIFVVIVTNVMKKRRAVNSMIIGMFLMPISAFSLSLGPLLADLIAPYYGETMAGLTVVTQQFIGPEGAKIVNAISFFGVFTLVPLSIMMIVGIAIQGLSECFISPRFLEYFSKQAPKGEEGLYLGFSHLHSCISAIIGFIISGFLLDTYCPDPRLFDAVNSSIVFLKNLGLQLQNVSVFTPAEIGSAYENAHYIWYYFAGIGLISAVALIIFRQVTDYLDRKHNRAQTM